MDSFLNLPGNLPVSQTLPLVRFADRRLHRLLVVSSWRSRSRRPRTLASRRNEPAWRTRPPIRSGSTRCVASTWRPEAFSIGAITPRASPSESSTAVVSSTSRMPSARATSRSNSRAISSTSPARFFSASKRRKLRTSCSSPPSSSSSAAALARWSICGLRRSPRSSGTWRCASTKSPSSSRTGSSLPASLAASKRARAYMRWATAISPFSVVSLQHAEVELADRLVDQAADPRAALVDQLLNRTEGVPLQDEQRDQEADDRPDHQARRALDQRIGAEEHQTRTYARIEPSRP